ncbi:hypothetical protein PVK06_017046 [Gossypium arboreum]|uniref:Uncharacterized protein n=1 Tax=Gossypium arboreum TaxID=29729 RepID=A0ABR0Q2T2_GOSAR|nr:hypothetical protein PVK06_017046 [Gossypium arboreum]
MGFQDLHLFNLALLGRQVWRLNNFKDTLCFKVLSAKYFPDGDMFRPKRCDRPSFTWASIAKVTIALKEGFIWQVGNDNLIDIRWVHWGMEDILRKLDSKVAADFFTPLWNYWNNRNKMVFQGKDDPAMMVWERAHTFNNDFRIFNLNEPPVILPTSVCKGWRKPPKDFIKINVDATVLNRNVSYRAIARDADGFVIAGSYVFENKAIDVV